MGAARAEPGSTAQVTALVVNCCQAAKHHLQVGWISGKIWSGAVSILGGGWWSLYLAQSVLSAAGGVGRGRGCVFIVLCCIADVCSCRKVVWSWDSLQGLQRG